MFITFEGGDGTGKTTQIAMLSEALRAAGRDVVVTREPGGSQGAEEIRSLVLQGASDRWSPETELLLFTAARRDHMEKVVWPALSDGKIVISDRFVDTTRVFQGMDSPDMAAKVEELHTMMIGGFTPDRTIILDVNPEEALGRAVGRMQGCSDAEDRFESRGLSFAEKTRAGFRALADQGGHYSLIDASGTREMVAARIWDALLTDIHPEIARFPA